MKKKETGKTKTIVIGLTFVLSILGLTIAILGLNPKKDNLTPLENKFLGRDGEGVQNFDSKVDDIEYRTVLGDNYELSIMINWTKEIGNYNVIYGEEIEGLEIFNYDGYSAPHDQSKYNIDHSLGTLNSGGRTLNNDDTHVENIPNNDYIYVDKDGDDLYDLNTLDESCENIYFGDHWDYRFTIDIDWNLQTIETNK